MCPFILLGNHKISVFTSLYYKEFPTINLPPSRLVVATCLWAVSNKYLLRPSCRGIDDVEWGFAFDVHLNAFFPVLVILHFVQARENPCIRQSHGLHQGWGVTELQ